MLESKPNDECYLETCTNKRRKGSYWCSEACQDIYWPKKRQTRFDNIIKKK